MTTLDTAAMADTTHTTRRQWLGASVLGLAVPWLHAQPAGAERLLQMVGPWEIAGLEPARSGYLFTRMQVAETLTDADDRGRALPGLAERWSVSADGLEWRFSLRPKARFHDGTAVTAAAVQQSLQQATRQAAGVLAVADVRGFDVVAADTVRVRLGKPFAALPALLAHSSVQVLAPAAYASDGSVRAVIGTGPYRIVRIKAPQQIEVAAFEGYDGAAPAIRRVRYLSASRAESRALMAEGGQSDLSWSLDPPSLQRFRVRGRPRIETAIIPRTILLKLNAGHPALSELRARQALSLAIDRAGIAKALLRDASLAATQLFPPVLADWHQPALAPLRHDPAAAATALQALGWVRGSDGMLSQGGQALRLKLRTYADRPELPPVATALQAQFRQVGIALEVSVGNSSDVPAGHRDGTLELGLAARNWAIAPDPLGTLLQDFAPQGGDWGAMGWRSVPLDTALASLARGTTDERAATLRAQVAGILQAELPLIPVAWFRQNVAVSERVTGVSLDPLERSYRLTRMRWT